MQSFFIGAGAVIASMLPWMLAQFGVANVAASGGIPDTVKYAFYGGGAVLLGAVLWTILTTREYAPAQLRSFTDNVADGPAVEVSLAWRPGVLLLLVGMAVLFAIRHFSLEKEVYLLASGLIASGLLLTWLSRTRSQGMLRDVLGDDAEERDPADLVAHGPIEEVADRRAFLDVVREMEMDVVEERALRCDCRRTRCHHEQRGGDAAPHPCMTRAV